MGKTALITGISGQDGAYLSEILLKKGYNVIGGDRRTSRGTLWRLEELGILQNIRITDFELSEITNIYRNIEKFQPNEIYNLAAQSFVGVSFETPLYTSEVTGIGPARILESIKSIDSSIKFYQASSSEMFGKSQSSPQDENTPFYPRSPYGVAKLYAHWMTVNYRESYDMYAVSGILFNHESPLRGVEFVTRKVTLGLAKIKMGIQDVLELGNLEAKRDWGFAGDYAEGIWRMMQQDKPDDYVLATGENHTIKEFIELAAPIYGFDLEWEGKGIDTIGIDKKTDKIIIRINPKYFRPAEVKQLLGNSSKAKKLLNWEPKFSFCDLVNLMAETDIKRIKDSQ